MIQALTGRKLEGTFHEEPTGKGRIREDVENKTLSFEPQMKRFDHPESDWYTIEYQPKGWKNHVVSRMWTPHIDVLMRYQLAVCREWTQRGYRDTCLAKSQLLMADSDVQSGSDPWWLGDERLHLSHRRSLIWKKPEFYQPIWPELAGENNYFWPTAV